MSRMLVMSDPHGYFGNRSGCKLWQEVEKNPYPAPYQELYQVEEPARSKPYDRNIPLYGILSGQKKFFYPTRRKTSPVRYGILPAILPSRKHSRRRVPPTRPAPLPNPRPGVLLPVGS